MDAKTSRIVIYAPARCNVQEVVPYRPMSVLLAIVLLTFLAVCDRIYGVSRRAKVGFMPNPAKVRSMVHRVPGVHEVRYQQTEGANLSRSAVSSPRQ